MLEIKTTSQKYENGFPTNYLSHDINILSAVTNILKCRYLQPGEIICDYDERSKETTVIMVQEYSLLLMPVRLKDER